MNALFHINQNTKWMSVLENVSNAIKHCEETLERFQIEVVANGDAVISLKEQAAINLKIIDKLTELSKKEVVFAACKNSLNKYAISEGDLIDFVVVVPSGVIEIIKKQEKEYSYIKP